MKVHCDPTPTADQNSSELTQKYFVRPKVEKRSYPATATLEIYVDTLPSTKYARLANTKSTRKAPELL